MNFLSFLLLLLTIFDSSNASIYNLTSGLFKAEHTSILNKTIHTLIGVPYAESPRPFQKPTEFEAPSFSKANPTDHWTPLCVQPVIFHNSFYGNFKLPHENEMSFSCLTINLYIPISESKNLSAMFFVHGGSNAAGGANYIDGSALASVGNVVVAMVNYRLDVLGFLSEQNGKNESRFKGNYGLWDLTMGLKWLFNNCESIGCDKHSITLFGHSAGSGDTLLLALSTHAQPYIKRIIMQSGSGLAHWSFLYETHLLDKISKSSNKANLVGLLKSLNYDKSQYINSLNDTFNNFISYTICNFTLKYSSMLKKMKSFFKILSASILNKVDKDELKYVLIVNNFLNSFDVNEILGVTGYLHKLMVDNLSRDKVQDILFNDNLGLFDELDSIELDEHQDSIVESYYKNLITRNNKNEKFDFEDLKRTSSNKSACYPDLVFVLSSSDNLILVCGFLKDFITNKNYEKLFKSKTIRFLLRSYQGYYQDLNKIEDYEHNNYVDSVMMHKSGLILNEIQKCSNQGIVDENFYLNFINSGSFQSIYEAYAVINNTIREISLLTENSNYLHRPTVDHDFMKQAPHVEIMTNEFVNNKIDVMVGLTSHESFYFLLHEYNINDILTHTFIYSSLINSTENLIEKLIEMNRSKDLYNCLKRSLFGFYNVSFSDLQLEKNGLRNKKNSLQLITDFDFVLPMVTQLKAFLKSNRNGSINKLYAYEYAHVSSFNYLLEHMKVYFSGYEKTLKSMNYSVTPHFSELDFVFGLPILSKLGLIASKNNDSLKYNYTQNEYDLSLLMIDYWTNFAKYGDPNFSYQNQTKKGYWKNFDSSTQNIFNINSNDQKGNKNAFEQWMKRHEFWYTSLPNKVYDECYFKHVENKSKLNTSANSIISNFDEIIKNSNGKIGRIDIFLFILCTQFICFCVKRFV